MTISWLTVMLFVPLMALIAKSISLTPAEFLTTAWSERARGSCLYADVWSCGHRRCR
ncbi:MAG: hypothetical protein U0936_18890 [Planctomycetaceae bacterium]